MGRRLVGMTETTQMPDFRSDLDTAQRWLAGLMGEVRPDQLSAPTPCSEYDVKALLEHVASHPAKLTAIAEGGDPRQLPDRAGISAEHPGTDYLERASAALGVWSDDALLTRTVTAPWGAAPGGMALGGFVMETIAHGWDLAVATGQDSEADPAVVGTAQAIAERALTDAGRGAGLPFGDRVEPRADAGPTERLAAFLGRTWQAAP